MDIEYRYNKVKSKHFSYLVETVAKAKNGSMVATRMTG